MSPARRPRGVVRALVVGGLVVIAGSAGAWAGATLLRPAPDVLVDRGFVLVDAREGSVGQDLSLAATARWEETATVQGSGSGTVTTVPWADGGVAAPGDVIYTVDLRPVVVAQGDVPGFRDLALGSRGADVLQLQQMLVATGDLSAEPDGTFGPSTDRAVRNWHAHLGMTTTGSDGGTVRVGDLLFVPQLPARLALGEDVVVGLQVSGSYTAARMLPDAPDFTVSLSERQTGIVTTGTSVELTAPEPGTTWHAVVREIRPADAEQPAVAVLAATEGSICTDRCDDLPVDLPTALPARLHVVPETSGVVVPAAAVVNEADGTTWVRLADGSKRSIDVLAGAQGQVVVDGVAVGEKVRTPGGAP